MLCDPTTIAKLDDDTAVLILQLLHQDGQSAVADLVGKGKGIEGTETDAQLAMRLFLEEEIEPSETFVADRKMARSIQTAVQLDGPACVLAREQERMAAIDRDICVSLSQGRAPPRAPSSRATDKSTNREEEELVKRLSCLFVTGIEDEHEGDGLESSEDEDTEDDMTAIPGGQPESSAWAASRKLKPQKMSISRKPGDKKYSRRCICCLERKHFAKVAALPCRHEYCQACIQRLFQDAMGDESLFPPRCCKQEIRICDQIRLLLTTELVNKFKLKAVEFSTPNRTYCHDPACAAFIPPTKYVDCVATCDLCNLRTCTTCKQASHNGDCPNDPELQRVLELARQQGWQRCQQCWRMVELVTGCNHMSCLCGFEFCYVCGAKWKSCRCAQWDEDRLYERAAEIDARRDRQGGNAAGQRINAIVRNLRVNHECGHAQWDWRGGSHRCERCHDVLPQYIFECRQCHTIACRRCRFNRL